MEIGVVSKETDGHLHLSLVFYFLFCRLPDIRKSIDVTGEVTETFIKTFWDDIK